jgi:hypothetical protein
MDQYNFLIVVELGCVKVCIPVVATTVSAAFVVADGGSVRGASLACISSWVAASSTPTAADDICGLLE